MNNRRNNTMTRNNNERDYYKNNNSNYAENDEAYGNNEIIEYGDHSNELSNFKNNKLSNQNYNTNNKGNNLFIPLPGQGGTFVQQDIIQTTVTRTRINSFEPSNQNNNKSEGLNLGGVMMAFVLFSLLIAGAIGITALVLH